MDIHKRAVWTSRIFDVLSWLVLVVGGIAFIGALVMLFSEPAFGWMLVWLVIGWTALSWATVSVWVLVAGYIGVRTDPKRNEYQ